jgi:hypothetical protein
MGPRGSLRSQVILPGRPVTPRTRRLWAIGGAAFFILMCLAIAWSQWYATHVNVPECQRRIAAGLHC